MKKHRQASLQRDAFLFCLSQTGNFTIAAEFAGLSSSTLRYQADKDSQFATAINDAFREACDRLLYVPFERAVKGVVIPQFYQGEEIGAINRPSDALLRYLLQRAATIAEQDKDSDQNEADYEALRAQLSERLAQIALSPFSLCVLCPSFNIMSHKALLFYKQHLIGFNGRFWPRLVPALVCAALINGMVNHPILPLQKMVITNEQAQLSQLHQR